MSNKFVAVHTFSGFRCQLLICFLFRQHRCCLYIFNFEAAIGLDQVLFVRAEKAATLYNINTLSTNMGLTDVYGNI